MAGYRVVGAAVQVVVGHRVHNVERGGFLPEGIDTDVAKALVGKGLVVAVKKPAADESKKPAPAKESKKPAPKKPADTPPADEKPADDSQSGEDQSDESQSDESSGENQDGSAA